VTSPDTNSLVSLSDADIMRMGVAALLRIAAAMEAQREPEPETLEYPLSQLKGFDWSAIGATIVATDEDGVSTIRTAEGKFAKRRSNDKFGVEVWFSYATGKKPDGTNLYRKVIEFKDSKPAEPLGRKTAQALSQATPAAVEPQKPADPPVSGRFASPLMEPILKRWKALALEAGQLGQADIPSRFILQPSLAVPECQHRTDELDQFVAGLRMAKADHAPAKAVSAPPVTNEPDPLHAARQWHAAAGRVSADNRAQLMEELQGWLRKLPACKIDLAKLSAQARMDEFGGWLKAQAVPA
jgi:hypothetical protein